MIKNAKNAKIIHFGLSGGNTAKKIKQKIKDIVIFELRTLKQILDNFRHRPPFMNFEINRSLMNIFPKLFLV